MADPTPISVPQIALDKAQLGQMILVHDQINKILIARLPIVQQESAMLRDQLGTLALQMDLLRQQQGLTANIADTLSSRMEQVNQSLTDAAARFVHTGKTGQEQFGALTGKASLFNAVFDEILSRMNHANSGWAAMGMMAGSALQGLIKGFSNVIAVARQAFSIFSSIAGAITDIGLTIISLPFRALNMLETIGESLEDLFVRTAEAFEEIRGTFGDFAYGASSAARALGTETENVAGVLSEFSILGYAPERLQFWNKTMQEAGDSVHILGGSVVGLHEELLLLTKGLGLTGKEFDALQSRSMLTGESLGGIMRDFAASSQYASREFGISVKAISKIMGAMSTDFVRFGTMAPRIMAGVSTYAIKMKMSFEDLTKVMDKFADFEDTATGAAKLSQAFGMNVDVMKLIRAQNPAEMVDELRSAFFATGKSVENMSRQERRLLQDLTGLSDAGMQAALSVDNQAMSYADLEEQMELSRDPAERQLDALKELTQSIQRLIFTAGQGGFLERFFGGFEDGIKHSQGLFGAFTSITKALRDFYWVGRSIGGAFAESFPGIKEFGDLIENIFDPKKSSKFLDEFKNIFKDFFKDMVDNPTSGFTSFLTKIENLFKDKWAFLMDSDKGKAFLEGGKRFLIAMSNIFAQGLKYILESVTSGILKLIEIIKDPSKLYDVVGAGNSFVGSLLEPILAAIMGAGEPLWNAFKDLLELTWSKLQPVLMDFYDKFKWYFAAVLFGPAIGQAIIATGLPLLMTSLTSVIGSAMQRLGDTSKLAEAVNPDKTGRFLDMLKFDFKSMASKMIALGGVLLIAGPILLLGVAAIVKTMTALGLTAPDVALGFGVMAAALVGLAAAGMAAKLLSNLDLPSVGKGFLAAGGVLVGASILMLAAQQASKWIFKDSGIFEDLAKFGIVAAIMMGGLLLAGLAFLGLGLMVSGPQGLVMLAGAGTAVLILSAIALLLDRFQNEKVVSIISNINEDSIKKFLKIGTFAADNLSNISGSIIKLNFLGLFGGDSLDNAIALVEGVGKLVKAVSAEVSNLTATPAQTEAFGNIALAIVSIMEPITEMGGFFMGDMSSTITALTSFFESGIIPLVGKIGTQIEESSRNIRSIGIMSAIGEMYANLFGGIASILGSFTTLQAQAGGWATWSDTQSEQTIKIINRIKYFIVGDGTTANPGLLPSIQGLIENLIQNINPEQADTLSKIGKGVGNLMNGMGYFVSSIIEAGSAAFVRDEESINAVMEIFPRILESVFGKDNNSGLRGFLSSLGTILPSLLSVQVPENGIKFSDITNFMKSIGEFITVVTPVISEAAAKNPNAINGAVGRELEQIFNSIFGTASSPGMITMIIAKMKEINSNAGDTTAINNGAATMENLGKSILSISTIITSLEESNTMISSLLAGSQSNFRPERLRIKIAELFGLINIIVGDNNSGVVKFIKGLRAKLEIIPLDQTQTIKKIENVATIFSKLSLVSPELKKLTTFRDVFAEINRGQLGADLAVFFAEGNPLDNIFSNLQGFTERNDTESLGRIITWSSTFKTALVGVFTALSEVKDVINQITLASNQVNQAMQGTEEQRINIGGKFEIKVKVEVSMDAKELASNLRTALIDEEGFSTTRPASGR